MGNEELLPQTTLIPYQGGANPTVNRGNRLHLRFQSNLTLVKTPYFSFKYSKLESSLSMSIPKSRGSNFF